MTTPTHQVKTIRRRLRKLRERETRESKQWHRQWLTIRRWMLLLYHEYVRDDVRIRAESLSFLMIFSMLPLVAGGFFLFSVFAQFGMVQDTIRDVVLRFLSTIPEAHRSFVEQYVLQFKDAYLANLASRSGSIGIFALFILIWVGLQTFNNVDRTLNIIWGADRERPFLEKARNFLVVSVAAPLAIIAALSLPHVMQKMQLSRGIVESVPFLLRFANNVIVPMVLFGTFACLYRFVPVRRVYWRSAVSGGIFAMIGLELSNVLMGFYFRFGTNSAYGKAAIVPLIGFWIYIVWVIVIMGAEFSYLLQNQNDILTAADREPTMREGHSLILALQHLLTAHRLGELPVSFERLTLLTGLETARLRSLVNYLKDESYIVEVVALPGSGEADYALRRDLAPLKVADVLRHYFDRSWDIDDSPVENGFDHAFDEWVGSFKETTIGDLTPSKPSRKKRGESSA